MEFRFDVPFPQDIGRLYPPVKTLFFGPGAKDFSKDLSLSYWEAASGKKVSRFISNLLHLVFQNAIDRWLERGWKRLPEVAKKQVSTYRRQAKTKRGRQPDPILALWAVTRFEKVRLQVSAVKKSYELRKFNEQTMQRVVERITSRDIVSKVLKKLVASENIDAIFVDRRFSVDRIALAILREELVRKVPQTSKHPLTPQKYLKLGEEIRILLAEVPQPIRIKRSS